MDAPATSRMGRVGRPPTRKVPRGPFKILFFYVDTELASQIKRINEIAGIDRHIFINSCIRHFMMTDGWKTLKQEQIKALDQYEKEIKELYGAK
jgi:hypothetical protein